MINIRRMLALVVVASAMAVGSTAGSEEIQSDPSAGATVAVSGDVGTGVFVLAKQEDGTYATVTSAVMAESGDAVLRVPVSSPEDLSLVLVAIAPDGSIVLATDSDQRWFWE